MPKMKTKKSAAKRFFVTGSGRIKRSCAYHRHLLMHKKMKAKRALRSGDVVHAADRASVRAMLPYC